MMQDQETGSEWSHILGRAQAGALKGSSLKVLPSTMTTWGAWKKRYPKTSVTLLEPTARDFQSRMLERGERFGQLLLFFLGFRDLFLGGVAFFRGVLLFLGVAVFGSVSFLRLRLRLL